MVWVKFKFDRIKIDLKLLAVQGFCILVEIDDYSLLTTCYYQTWSGLVVGLRTAVSQIETIIKTVSSPLIDVFPLSTS